MKPPIELYRPTILNIIAIISYCLAAMFHIIAYATDNWASLMLDGVRWRMGLWQGCRELDGEEHCTSDVFEDKAFQTGSDWHLGARVMMTLALILLFMLEFTLIGYACIKSLEKFKSQLVGSTIAISLSTALFHILSLIFYSSSMADIPEATIKTSYGLVILCILVEVTIPIPLAIDKCRGYPVKMPRSLSGNELKSSGTEEVVTKRDDGYNLFTIEGAPSSVATSRTSLSEAETFRKFAYDDWENGSLSMGSSFSVHTQSTLHTNVSQLSSVSKESTI